MSSTAIVVKMMADRYSGATYLHDIWADQDGNEIHLSEPIAWGLLEAREQDMEGGHKPWPCFAPGLVRKLEAFCDSIV
jgi:hypothetical protein